MVSAELLLHPVRLRIVQTLLGGRQLTTAGLGSELPEVPAATLYRQVAALADAGLLEVVNERKVRGTTERTYSLRTEHVTVGAREFSSMSVEEHRRAFMAFTAGLLSDFDRYFADDCIDPAAVGYRQNALWLTDEEMSAFVDELRGVVLPRLSLAAGAGRSRRLFSTVLIPAADPREPEAG